MGVLRYGWTGLVGISALAVLGGCFTAETFPADQRTGGLGGTAGAGPCMRDEDCTAMSVAVCQRPVCSGGRCVAEPDDSQQCGTNPPVTHCEGGKCTGCTTDQDCIRTECEVGTCSMENECIPTYGPTDLFQDPSGDCTKRSCGDTGLLIKELDTTDGPADDGNECTKEECVDMGAEGGMAVHTPQEGKACGEGPTCVDGTAKAQDTCDMTGLCVAGGTMDCFPGLCDGDACKMGCAADLDCAMWAYCDVGQSICVAKKLDGKTCTLGAECTSGSCPQDDGICCTSGCSDPCRTCYSNGMAGTCGNLSKGVVDTCPSGQACDGSGSCAGLGGKKAVGQPCSQSSDCFAHLGTGCVQGLCRLHAGETCDPAKPHECETNLCDPATHQCKECTQGTDCPSGACEVNNKRCYLAAGGVCGNASDCLSGLACTNNVCAQP